MACPLPEKNFFTIKEVANICDVHRNTVRNWIVKGYLKATRFGGKAFRISRDNLNSFLDSSENH